MLRLIKHTVWILLLSSCSAEISPIHYGSDACDFCRMTITDPKYGGELITSKGRVYKFDAAECMAAFYKSHQSATIKFTRMAVTDFSHPGKMLDIKQAVLFQGDQINSPMGANIAAFPDRQSIKKIAVAGSGKLLEWNDLLKTVH